ncbi:putative AMP-binding enzyme [Penicillium brasilianum]|uniref:Putative AMP-binding enzyme n=1 Tax=Penicillium brasilianum TaxID=104259 RepID=A0A1S9R963_PENBI|nr:putative AMP-binding enzyme [Penicillium brasilianum]
MIFTSQQPSISIPEDVTIWEWLFTSSTSPLSQHKTSDLGGFTNAATKERIGYDLAKEYATKISTALVHKFGLSKGDVVALFSPNTVWYPIAMFATNRVGGMISGASPAYNVEEMTFALRTAQAKVLMTAVSSLPVAIPAAKNAGISQDRIILLEGRKEDFTSIQDLVVFGAGFGPNGQVQPFKIPAGQTNKDICGFLSFSSGTTGLPKAVMISHHNVIAQSMQVEQITSKGNKKVLAVLPLFHITGLVHQMHLPVFRNSEVYMLPAFTMKAMLDTVVQYQITELLLVPPILIRLLRDPIVKDYNLSHVRKFSSGAAPLSSEIIQELKRQFPNTGFKQGYGMTESCSCITAHPLEKSTYEYAHCGGTIVANTEVKIINPEMGIALGYNEPGEILARGPQIVMGYLNNEKATEETFDADGWLHTGDVGFIDEEGFITITDRIKEMIKVKGIAVAPAELEDLLLGHPMVEDVAVGPIPDDYTGQRPKAYVVLKPGIRHGKDRSAILKSLNELIDYVRGKKVRHKWITEIEMLKEIPKSASGKILRRMLRKLEQEDSSKERYIITRGETKSKL